MPTPEEIVKAAQEQEAEAKRKADHQVQDLRQLNPNVDPEEEAESAVPTENIILGAHEEAEGGDASPFASLSESVQASLKDAGITTLEKAKVLGLEGLVKLDNIGDVTAKSILAL